MARFRGTVEGNRSEASRLGHASSGLRTDCNGWTAGVRVYASAAGDSDVFQIIATEGSGYGGHQYEIGRIQDGRLILNVDAPEVEAAIRDILG